MNMTVSALCQRSLQIAGRGDKPTTDDLAQCIVSLNSMLASWRLRGVDLFNIHDQQAILPVQTAVLNDGDSYVCIRTNTATADDEPGTGDDWQNYWSITENLTATLAWTVGTTYNASNRFFPAGLTNKMVEIVNPRIVKEGNASTVEIVGRDTFFELDPSELGIPTKMFQAPGNALELFMHPTPDYENILLLFTGVMVPDDQRQNTNVFIPPTWFQALQYGLAAEMGYYFVLPPDRLGVLNNKAEVEFRRALGSDKGEVDSCRVDPCY